MDVKKICNPKQLTHLCNISFTLFSQLTSRVQTDKLYSYTLLAFSLGLRSETAQHCLLGRVYLRVSVSDNKQQTTLKQPKGKMISFVLIWPRPQQLLLETFSQLNNNLCSCLGSVGVYRFHLRSHCATEANTCLQFAALMQWFRSYPCEEGSIAGSDN